MLAAKMKLRLTVAASLLASLLILASANIAQAQWNAISSGYAVTTNWHGQEVPIGQTVIATAGTTVAGVQKVQFKWHAPNGTVIWNVFVGVSELIAPALPPLPVPQEVIDWANNNQGVKYWYAQDTQIPMVIGDWGVQAIFHDTGNIMGKNSDMVAIRGTSFEVVPEVPFGTIAILVSMFGALGVFAIKRKHLPAKTSS